MEQTITLNKAFKVRNLLKAELEKVSRMYRMAPKTLEVGKQEKYTSTHGKTTKDLAQTMFFLQDVLSKFNVCIEQANVSAALCICELNQKRDILRLIETLILDLQRGTYEQTNTNHVTGEEKIILFEPFEDVNIFLQMENELKADILVKEDKLSQLNAEQVVNLTEDICNAIKNIIPGV